MTYLFLNGLQYRFEAYPFALGVLVLRFLRGVEPVPDSFELLYRGLRFGSFGIIEDRERARVDVLVVLVAGRTIGYHPIESGKEFVLVFHAFENRKAVGPSFLGRKRHEFPNLFFGR